MYNVFETTSNARECENKNGFNPYKKSLHQRNGFCRVKTTKETGLCRAKTIEQTGFCMIKTIEETGFVGLIRRNGVK